MRKLLLISILFLTGLSICGCSTKVERVLPFELSFDFSKKDSNAKVTYEGTADLTKEVKLYIGDGYSYAVRVPADMTVTTDYSTYVCSVDETVQIRIITGATIENLKEISQIRDARELKPYVIGSELKKKGIQEAAAHIVNDKAVIVQSAGNSRAYETILQGLLLNSYKRVEVGEIEASDLVTKRLSKLPDYEWSLDSGFTIEFDEKLQKAYVFKQGSLTITREMRGFRDAVDNMSKKLVTVAGDNVARKIYEDDGFLYVELKDFTAAIIEENYNTCVTVFSSGDEGRYYAVQYLKSLEEE